MTALFAKINAVLLSLVVASAAWGGELNKDIENLLRRDFPDENTGPGAVLLVTSGDKIVHCSSVGKADLELNVRLQTDDVFCLGSLTKQFTACAILRLAEKGLLSLDDDIRRFLPDFQSGGQVITIEHLLTHTSGLKDFTSRPDFARDIARRDLTPRELVGLFNGAPLDFKPGERYAYTNSGYILLGCIIESITGQSYESFVEKEFFAPLSMTSSHFQRAASLIPHRVHGYKTNALAYENAEYISMTVPYAAGGAFSNVQDLHRWISAVASGRVITAESLRRAWRPYRLRDGQFSQYGYGWELGNVQGSASVRHIGRINGFITYQLYLPKEQVLVILLSNCEADRNLEMTASEIAALTIGRPFQRAVIPLAVPIPDMLNGVYASEDGARFAFAKEDERLVFMPLGGEKVEVYPSGPDRFFFGRELSTLEAKRDGDGRIISLELTGLNPSKHLVRTAQIRRPMQKLSLSEAALDRYVGQYAFSPEFALTVARQGDVLTASAFGRKVELIPFAEGSFYARDIDLQLIFTSNADGRMTVIKRQNGETTGQRVPS